MNEKEYMLNFFINMKPTNNFINFQVISNNMSGFIAVLP